MDLDLIKSLKPIGDGTFDKEPFEEYKKRAAPLLPNFPECALKNWIYRHYADIDNYSFLGFEKMHFKEELWSKDDIYNYIKSFYPDLIDSLGYQIYARHDKSWLQKYMLKHKTWNAPIIVYQNTSHPDIGKPYHL
ncbi:hypothetical protein [Ammoniphilus sp. CFH 90114]|uniref:hypothetical protein n=1 Tax=Ammoniphilus sp. CFH 90114 TaxID=2493665 RepID=UPI00100E03C1|nr:hypothetical protein [Ammoniphilus sp. CFH 90114]RXT08925.1 hypothetical protein EIZ39_09015 [Ammoniphilus sp. CFH 90114]